MSIQFFTSIPIPYEVPMDRVHIEKAIKTFPLLGLLQGMFYAFLLYGLIQWTPLSPLAAAFFVWLALIVLTGGIHLDGWMDASDAFFSYRDRQKRLEIMKDPRVGAFGVLSVMVLLSARFLFIYEISLRAVDATFVLIVLIPFLSKSVMGILLIKVRAAKEEGLGTLFKQACNSAHTLDLSRLYGACARGDFACVSGSDEWGLIVNGYGYPIFAVCCKESRQMVWGDNRRCNRCISRRSGARIMDDAVVVALFRHGLTEENKRHAYIGWTDSPICEDARLVLAKQIVQPSSYERIVTSDLKRCLQTAEILFPDQSLLALSEFREMHFGRWEGKTYAELAGDPHYEEWINHHFTSEPPEGESYPIFTERVEKGWQELNELIVEERFKSLAIVTHGGVMRYLLSKLSPRNGIFGSGKFLMDRDLNLYGQAMKHSGGVTDAICYGRCL